jgi:endonuclease/exonuclease/phosphatase family metal-dependent hydrolase
MGKKTRSNSKTGIFVLLFLIIIIILCLVFFFRGPAKIIQPPSSSVSPIPAFTDTITIMSYNVENLFDMIDDGNEYPEFKPNHCDWNDYTYQVRLQNIASVLLSARPEIVALYEVENLHVLDALRDALSKRGLEYPYRAIADKPNQSMTSPSILSLFPIISSRGIGTVMTETHWSRNILQASIQIGSDTVTIFANHWPSRKYPESFRIAAGEKLSTQLKQLPASAEYIIMGDFNEDYNECEKGFTEGMDDSKGATGINHILHTVTSLPYQFIAFTSESTLSLSSQPALYDLWLELPENKRGSYNYHGQWGTIDHMLLPKTLYDDRGLSYLDNSFSVFTMHDSLLMDGVPYRWQVVYGAFCKYHKGKGYSDHLPIIARFYCGGFKDKEPEMGQGQETGKSLKSIPGTIGFESGFEGWVCSEKGVSITRQSVSPFDGKYCLKIASRLQKDNLTLARVAIPPAQILTSNPQQITFHLQGAGQLSFRVREAGNKKWRYFNGFEFKNAGVARYTEYRFIAWKKISLPLSGIISKKSGIEFEIRSAKNAATNVLIDDVSIQ